MLAAQHSRDLRHVTNLRNPEYMPSASVTSSRPIDDWAINRRLTLQQNQTDPLIRLNR